MKKSIINNYVAALQTLINDNRITFAITCNFLDKCRLAVYFSNQFLCNIEIFNDSSVINLDNLVNDYATIMLKHPIKECSKQLFSLRYNTDGYCSLAITDAHNLELFGVSHKRISKKLADYLFNEIAIDSYYYVSDYCSRYNTTYDFAQTILFKI